MICLHSICCCLLLKIVIFSEIFLCLLLTSLIILFVVLDLGRIRGNVNTLPSSSCSIQVPFQAVVLQLPFDLCYLGAGLFS